ncbi:TPA: hypothetical protein HA265_06520 [Candidatus Woesearchaeota archaeon]|nr:hypothetical protein [Candidatus Woesearchaeota archaeon]
MTDRFLDVMVDQIAEGMKRKKEERFFRIQVERPKYISMTYLERDTREATFLNGRPHSAEGTSQDTGADIRVLFGRASQGYGQGISVIPRMVRDPNTLEWNLKQSIDEAIDDAFEDYGTRASMSSKKKEPRDKRRVMVQHSKNETDEPYVSKKDILPSIPDRLKKRLEAWTHHMFWKDVYMRQAEASISSERILRRFVDSEGRMIKDNLVSRRISISLEFKHSDNDETMIYDMPFAFPDWKSAERQLEGLLNRIEEDVDNIRFAKVLPSGSYPMVFDGMTTCTVLHEALYGHNTSATRWKNGGNNVWSNKVGKRITPVDLTIVDRPKDIGYLYDDEGIPTKVTEILDGGKLVGPLDTRDSAGYYNRSSNGHARRAWVHDGGSPLECQPRPFNIKAFSKNPLPDDEVMKKALDYARREGKEFVVYLKAYTGQVDADAEDETPATGRIDAENLLAYKIFVDGREREHVDFFKITDTPYELLKRFKAVGTNLATSYGYCIDSSGPIPLQETGPMVFVSSVNVQSTRPVDEE